jgi:hypothetical protein
MAVVPTNLTQGPGVMWWAPFGTATPADSAFASTPPNFSDAGGTQGGVMAEVDSTYTDQIVDQITLPIGGRLTAQSISVTTSLAETTLQNFNLAMNQTVQLGVQSAYTTSDINTATSATQPYYTTLIIDGWAPTTGTAEISCRRRIIIYKVLSKSKATFSYEKEKNAIYAVTFEAYFVSGSVSPWHSIDQTT